MAGLGEACSHVAAAIRYLQAHDKLNIVTSLEGVVLAEVLADEARSNHL